MKNSELIITDSGAARRGDGLGIPVVVLRNITERPEGLEAEP
ncbi:MAG: hypothetical protein R2865_13365 [Deinococcales bacterium]